MPNIVQGGGEVAAPAPKPKPSAGPVQTPNSTLGIPFTPAPPSVSSEQVIAKDAQRLAQWQRQQQKAADKATRLDTRIKANLEAARATADTQSPGFQAYVDQQRKARDNISNFLNTISDGAYTPRSTIFDRARGIPQEAVSTAPQTMAGTLFSGVPHNMLNSVGWAVQGSGVYFDQIHSFVGLPGALMLAHARTSNIKNLASREYAINFLNFIQQRAPAEQQIIWNALVSGVPADQLGEGSDYANAHLANIFSAHWSDTPGSPTTGQQRVDAIRAIFPQADAPSLVGYKPPTSWSDQASIPDLALDWVGGGGNMSNIDRLQAAAGDVAGGVSEGFRLTFGGIGNVLGGITRKFVPGGTTIADVASTGIKYGVGALNYTERAAQSVFIDAKLANDWAANAITRQPQENIWAQMAHYAPALSLEQSANEPVVQYGLDKMGVMPGEYQGFTDLFNLGVQLGVTGELVGAAGELRAAGRVPSSYTSIIDYKGNAFGGEATEYLHPLAQAVRKAGAMTVEEFVWDQKGFGRIMDEIKRVRENSAYEGDPALMGAALNLSMRKISLPLATELVKTGDITAWQHMFTQSYYGVPYAGTLGRMADRVSGLDKDLNDLVKQRNTTPEAASAIEPQVLGLKNLKDTPEIASVKASTREAMFAAGSDPAYVYRWITKDRLPDVRTQGSLPQTPADITIDPTAQTGVYFGATAEGAYNSLPMASARDAVLLRAPIDESIVPTTGIQGQNFGEHISLGPVGPDRLSLLEEDGQWHPLSPKAKATPVHNISAAELDDQILDLRAEKIAAENELWNMRNQLPMDVWPRASSYRRVISDNPKNSFEKFMHSVTRNDWLNVTDFVDHAPFSSKMWFPGTRADWLEHNIEYSTKLMRLAHVPEIDIVKAVAKMGEVRTPGDLLAWAEKLGPTLEKGVTKDGARYVHPTILGKFNRVFDRPEENRARSAYFEASTPDPAGRIFHTRKDVLTRPSKTEPGQFISVPAMTSEIMGEGGFKLPSVDSVRAGTSFVRRWQFQWSKEGGAGLVKRAAFIPYNVVAQMLDISTSIMKPIIMVPRIIAMGTRIQMEQMLRNNYYGYKAFMMPEGFRNLVPLASDVILDSRVGQYLWGKDGLWPHNVDPLSGKPSTPAFNSLEDYNTLGLLGASTHEATFLEQRAWLTTAKFRDDPTLWLTSPDAKPLLDGIVDQIGSMRGAPEVQYLALHGVAKTMKWLKTDAFGSDLMIKDIQPLLDRSGATLEEWLGNANKMLDHATLENPGLRKSVGTGKISSTKAGDTEPFAGYGDAAGVRYAYDNQLSKLQATSINIKEGLANGLDKDMMDFLYQERADAQAALGEIGKNLREGDTYLPDTRPGPNVLNRKKAMKEWNLSKSDLEDYINQGVVSGELKLPPEVNVDMSRGVATRAKDMSTLGHLHNVVDSWNHVLYSKLANLGKVDVALTRGSLWKQVYDEEFTKLTNKGWEADRAGAIAKAKAGSITRDVMYDLAEQTSAHRSIRNLFWFAPAWQEVLGTWLVKIPAQFYWPIGMSYLAQRAQLFTTALKDIGVITTETDKFGQKQDVVHFDFVSAIINKFAGTSIPSLLTAKTSGFSLATSGLPGLATAPAFFLGQADKKWEGPFKALSHVLLPYGPDAIPGPSSLYYGWEAIFGTNPPWSHLSGQYGQDLFDRSKDQAIQYAYSKFIAAGNLPPNIADFSHEKDAAGNLVPSAADGTKFRLATKAWWDSLSFEADSLFMGMAMGKTLGAAFLPSSVTPSTAERKAWEEFYAAQIIPAERDPNGSYSEFQKNLIASYVNKHPGSLAFTVSSVIAGDKAKNLPYTTNSSAEEYYTKLRNGELDQLSPEQYLLRLQAISAQQSYRAHLNAAYAEAGSSWQQQITGGYKTNALVSPIIDSWNAYLYNNHDVKNYLEGEKFRFADQYGYDAQGFASEQNAEAYKILKQVSPFFIGAGGLQDTSLKKVLGKLGQLYSDTATFGAPVTRVDKAKAYWYQNVWTPYEEKVGPLYDKANALYVAGDPAASMVYDQIKTITESYGSSVKTPYGKGPTPEQHIFGNLSPEGKDNARAAWATKPPSWLTPFQLKQSGMPNSPQAQKFYDTQSTTTDIFYKYIYDHKISPSSTEYQNIKDQEAQYLTAQANKLGPTAIKAYQLSTQAPIVRLAYAGYGDNSPEWKQLISGVAATTRLIKADSPTGSVKGYSSDVGLPDKIYLEKLIEHYRDPGTKMNPNSDYSPAFDNLWASLGRAIPLQGQSTREGVYLYEAILFGQFETAYISPFLKQALSTK